ncbi:histidinol-phosphatase (PHP family) [Geomicrobium halophilum]|uniref:Histidinol-phosphatase n=1 Tax=Geomicrobium halophilum TaxID=549000 RepID=A0A841PKE9_9BACL|nr:histidinol-phosphatase HisJ [Geomicrobium halophilum]MBB6448144.1 histidinol-phosphatase (PHP family) [Geomicrobium halophilum]
MKIIEYDGHVHTPFCPHGSQAPFKQYIETAIQHGYKGVSFCEHAPLPNSFPDPTPKKDSSMALSELEAYIKTIRDVRKSYKNDITIRIGLEVDFIEGYESETQQLLNHYGPYLDDSILSVHFIKAEGSFGLLDYSVDAFQTLAQKIGGIEPLVHRYYETLLQSIEADLGKYKPRRLGHMSLVRKFQKEFNLPSDEQWLEKVLHAVKKSGLSLDINGAGVVKPLCGETYPPLHFIQKAHDLGIPLVYGSDAHHPDGLGQGSEALPQVAFSSP